MITALLIAILFAAAGTWHVHCWLSRREPQPVESLRDPVIDEAVNSVFGVTTLFRTPVSAVREANTVEASNLLPAMPFEASPVRSLTEQMMNAANDPSFSRRQLAAQQNMGYYGKPARYGLTGSIGSIGGSFLSSLLDIYHR